MREKYFIEPGANVLQPACTGTQLMAQVEIYGTSYCRHCLAARKLLDSKQINYTEYLIDLMPLERAEMLRRCGRKKVPQILINNVPIGGDEDLMALDASGELDRLLNR